MSKAKLSVTVDQELLDRARDLRGGGTVSETLGAALEALIAGELDRRHIEGYLRWPPSHEEDAWADAERDSADLADDVDWAALYGIGPSR